MAYPERPPLPISTPPTQWGPPVTAFPPAMPPQGRPAPPARHRFIGRPLAVAALCLLSGLLGGAVVRVTQPEPEARTAPASAATTLPVTAEPPRDDAPLTAGSVAMVARTAKPAMVTIETGDGAGSGVITSADGVIITNAHVVEGSTRVLVRLADGTELQGDVVGADSDVDVAVVKVNRTGLPAVKLGSARTLRPGDQVVAVGAPLGLEGSVSAGVVSALGRTVPIDLGGIRAAIQTDAAINPGNSGGALFDMNGNVVGITTAKAGGSAIENIGFAVPIDIAQSIAADLLAGRPPSHPYLGISGPEVDAATAEALGSRPGARITDVGSGTPAATAGLEPGDVIVAIDGAPVRSFFELSVTVATRRAGQTVALGLDDGTRVSLTLAERPRG